MSSTPPVPINAPWLSTWQRYPVQFQTFDYTDPVIPKVFVPDGQWWRPVWSIATVTSDGNAGNRSLFWGIRAPAATGSIVVPINGTFVASSTSITTAWPGASAYNVTTQTGEHDFVISYPDMVWPPGTEFFWQYATIGGGDAFSTTGTLMAVEIYTEEYSAAGTVTLVPAPTLT